MRRACPSFATQASDPVQGTVRELRPAGDPDQTEGSRPDPFQVAARDRA